MKHNSVVSIVYCEGHVNSLQVVTVDKGREVLSWVSFLRLFTRQHLCLMLNEAKLQVRDGTCVQYS